MIRHLTPLVLLLAAAPAAQPAEHPAVVARFGTPRLNVGRFWKPFVSPDGTRLLTPTQCFDLTANRPQPMPVTFDAEERLHQWLPGDRFLTQTGKAWRLRGRDGVSVSLEVADDGFVQAARSGRWLFTVGRVANGGRLLAAGWSDRQGLGPWRPLLETENTLYLCGVSDDGGRLLCQEAGRAGHFVADRATGLRTAIPPKDDQQHRVFSAVLSPDGKTAVQVLEDKLRVVDATTGAERRVAPARLAHFVSNIRLSSDGERLHATHHDQAVFSFPLDVAGPAGPPVVYTDFKVSQLVPLPDGKRAVASDDRGFVHRLDLATGRRADRMQFPGPWQAAAFLADGSVACWGGSRVVIWELATGTASRTTDVVVTTGGQRRPVHLTDVSADGKRAVGLAQDVGLVTADLVTGAVREELPRLDFSFRPHFRPGQPTWVARGGADDHSIGFTTADPSATAAPRPLALPHTARLCDLHPNGRLALAAGADGVGLYELASGKPRWTFRPPQREHNNSYSYLLASLTGRRRAVVLEGNDGYVFDTTAGRLGALFPLRPPAERHLSAARSACGRWLVTLAARHDDRDVSVLRRYDVESDAPADTLREARLPDGPGATGLALNADGSRLVTLHPDGTAVVWDTAKLFPPPPAPPAADDWTLLAAVDPAVAQRAMTRLADTPDRLVRVFTEKLPPAVAVPAAEVARQIARLGDAEFAIREAGERALLAVIDQAEPALREALARPANEEQRARLGTLLGKWADLAADGRRLRELRAVELLERAGTPAADDLLKRYAEGAPAAALSREATAAARRRK